MILRLSTYFDVSSVELEHEIDDAREEYDYVTWVRKPQQEDGEIQHSDDCSQNYGGTLRDVASVDAPDKPRDYRNVEYQKHSATP